jgi:hypothetical protein
MGKGGGRGKRIFTKLCKYNWPFREDTDVSFQTEVFWVNTDYGSNRVNRGGSWNNDAQNCRVANRNNDNPSNSNNNLGFRLVSTKSGCNGSLRISVQAVFRPGIHPARSEKKSFLPPKSEDTAGSSRKALRKNFRSCWWFVCVFPKRVLLCGCHYEREKKGVY